MIAGREPFKEAMQYTGFQSERSNIVNGAGFKPAQGVDQSMTLVIMTGLAVRYPPDDHQFTDSPLQ